MKQEYTKKILFLSISIIVLLVIALGSTYAIFTYTKLGTTDNTITTGTLKFLYTENSTGGTGINISEAEPISDTQGKELVGDKNVFDFKIAGTNTSNSDLPYGITLKKKSDSTLVDEGVKVYLTEVAGNSETVLIGPTLYSELTQSAQSSDNEKVIYVNKVAANSKSYEKSFRLRIWIDENLDFSSGNYNNKTFTATVNVYSNDKVKMEQIQY